MNSGMGQNAGTVEETLEQRGGVYGDYGLACDDRAIIMKVLKRRHELLNGKPMSETIEIMFGDMVLKLVRGAGAPTHTDSFHDLSGYSSLTEKAIEKLKAGALL